MDRIPQFSQSLISLLCLPNSHQKQQRGIGGPAISWEPLESICGSVSDKRYFIPSWVGNAEESMGLVYHGRHSSPRLAPLSPVLTSNCQHSFLCLTTFSCCWNLLWQYSLISVGTRYVKSQLPHLLVLRVSSVGLSSRLPYG